MSQDKTVEILEHWYHETKFWDISSEVDTKRAEALQEAIKAIAERDDNWQLYLQETKKHEEYFNKYKQLLSRVTVEGIRRIIIDKELMPAVCEDSGQAEWTVGESEHLATAIYNFIRRDK